MLIIRHAEVRDVLAGREQEVVDAVRTAYLLHHEGASVLPHSTFLRLPSADGSPTPNRIIGLPAYLGGDSASAGMKWISSFPGNVQRGHDRASALMVLNSVETGHPMTVVEASLISAARTAASAALAAELLLPPGVEPPSGITLIGCGVINLAILRYIRVLCPSVQHVVAHDRDLDRAAAFVHRCAQEFPGADVTAVSDPRKALGAQELVSFATTASTPHLELDPALPNATVLHISLRDLGVGSILAHHNIVDDAGHACRENTSVHLAELATGHRDFVDGSLAELIVSGKPLQRDGSKHVIFSPFGLGVLDLAVGQLVRDAAVRNGLGVRVEDFMPT